jgi:hypothetical protein
VRIDGGEVKTPLERIAEAQLHNPELQDHQLYAEIVHDEVCPRQGTQPCECNPDIYIIHPDDEGYMHVLEGGKIERVLDG